MELTATEFMEHERLRRVAIEHTNALFNGLKIKAETNNITWDDIVDMMSEFTEPVAQRWMDGTIRYSCMTKDGLCVNIGISLPMNDVEFYVHNMWEGRYFVYKRLLTPMERMLDTLIFSENKFLVWADVEIGGY